ncbi:MAG: deoxyribodipyrimidine photo-lyase [Campylobacterales bacterium]|nr:deoxyribodipyrimidine photo-lyase [Campylobacterales bacterium]
MRQILWFRRDLRITDSAILAHARDEVLPIFIFDPHILSQLEPTDRRVGFIYRQVLRLKSELQSVGLDLAIFYDTPERVFAQLQTQGFDEILCSVDYDDYAKKRDKQIEQIMPMRRFTDSYMVDPATHLTQSHTPYKVFTPFYKSLFFLWESNQLETYPTPRHLRLIPFDDATIPSLESLGFTEQPLPDFLSLTPDELIDEFIPKLKKYHHDRDFINIDGTSKLATFLRFGLISPREVFNRIRPYTESKPFIRQLFFREFYAYLLYHFPHSEFENQKPIKVEWSQNQEHFKLWCEGQTGVPIIDAAMRHFNQTGVMHNRLRMIVASYLTKNLLIDWRWGERYFAAHLLDYDASANIASWQWAASTGSDAVPYFRVFNPYTQSQKFDKEAEFIKSVIPELRELPAKKIHTENGVQSDIFVDYPEQIVGIKASRDRAIAAFQEG